MLTKQEVFDRSAAHLLKQGEKALDSNGHCRYRGPRGLKCAVGCLIPEGNYTPEIEGLPADDPLVVEAVGGIGGDCIGLVLQLQDIHDHHLAGDWPTLLCGVAACRGLQYNPAEIEGGDES